MNKIFILNHFLESESVEAVEIENKSTCALEFEMPPIKFYTVHYLKY